MSEMNEETVKFSSYIAVHTGWTVTYTDVGVIGTKSDHAHINKWSRIASPAREYAYRISRMEPEFNNGSTKYKYKLK